MVHVPGPAGISRREAEVLAALGEHLTNAEIAARFVISVRTVESHVSSLLRKLQAADRRGLAALAAAEAPDPVGASSSPGAGTAVASLPSPLTPFVGRLIERAALAAALVEHRLVTATGPGGVGKTRLGLSVAADVVDRFPDGVWYVDLVPVSDPAMVAAAICDAVGLGERPGSTPADDLARWLADRQALLLLDNCEHLLDGVVVLVERLLAAAPRVRVLATSRARLLVPFERVFPVPGLSVVADDGGPGDAVALFRDRAAAGGGEVRAEDLERVASICRALDGMALAIELAAARYPSLGPDGLADGLADRLRLLTGSPRVDDRHRSLRSTLDWSHALLDPADRAVLRRVSVFVDPFPAGAAQDLLADWPPVRAADVPTALAHLADQSLLVARRGPDGTRYRALETVRQYGADLLDEAGEATEARVRHLRWCADRCAALGVAAREAGSGWRAAFDRVADEVRSALTWASGQPAQRAAAHRLALALAGLAFTRGVPGEAQRRYEQAAGLADGDLAAADAWRSAAGAAESRHVGDAALALHRRAAEAALRAGDRAGAAADLAVTAERINRGPGLLATAVPPAEVTALIERSRELAGDDPAARVRLLIAEAFAGATHDPATRQVIRRALDLAVELADPLAESAALDQLCAVQLAHGEIRAAAASALRRTELVAPLPVAATTGFEFFDSFVMASECAIAAGDLPGARRLAEGLRDLPFYREEGHLASGRLLVVTVLAGDWDEAAVLAERFRDGWERAGSPRAGNLSRAAYAAATLCGLRGDDAGRAAWVDDVVGGLTTPGRPSAHLHVGAFFDALLLLHRGEPATAVQRMAAPPEELSEWYDGMWRPWYAALWAEAAVLCGSGEAPDRLRRARLATTDNPVADAVVDRAAALLEPGRPGGGRDGLLAAAAALDAAGCRYQWARTLVLAGGEHRRRGASALAAMGASPMAAPGGTPWGRA